MKARIFAQREGECFKVASLEYNANDASMYLFIPNRLGVNGKRSQSEMLGLPGHNFRININEFDKNAEFDHFSIHGSGIEHTVLKEGDKVGRAQWTPLKGLEQARHLWTLVLPEMKDLTADSATRLRDLKIDYPLNMTGGVIDIIATPKGQNINFNVEYLENNDKPTVHIFGQAVWDLPDYRIYVFSRSSDKHEGSPKGTVKITLPEDFVPLITNITPYFIEGTVAKLINSTPPKK